MVIALIVVVVLFMASPDSLASGEVSPDFCKEALPKPLASLISVRFHQWKIMSDEWLGGYEEYYRKERPTGCPGVVGLDLYGNGKRVFAISILRESTKGLKSKLLLAEQDKSKTWVVKTLWNDECDCVVMSVPPGEDTDVGRGHRIAGVGEGIVFLKYEAYAIVFRWTGKKVEHVYVMD